MTKVQRPIVKSKTDYEEEAEERDDKIIGKALRWSLLVLLVVGAGVAGGIVRDGRLLEPGEPIGL